MTDEELKKGILAHERLFQTNYQGDNYTSNKHFITTMRNELLKSSENGHLAYILQKTDITTEDFKNVIENSTNVYAQK